MVAVTDRYSVPSRAAQDIPAEDIPVVEQVADVVAGQYSSARTV